MQIEIENGNVEAISWFDPEMGMLVESVADQTINMKITAQGQVLPSVAKQTITTKILDVADAL